LFLKATELSYFRNADCRDCIKLTAVVKNIITGFFSKFQGMLFVKQVEG